MKKIVIAFGLMMSTALLFAQAKKTVAQDGSGDFTTVQAAVDAVPDGNTSPVIIYIKKGIYKECITISTRKHLSNSLEKMWKIQN